MRVVLAAALCMVCGVVAAMPQPSKNFFFRSWQKRISSTTSDVDQFDDDHPIAENSNQLTVQQSRLRIRSPRGQAQYDVPQIECPKANDGLPRFACPTPDRHGRYHCIEDHLLCDGFIHCPAAEDEDRQLCMFYKTTKAHLDVLADGLLRWVMGR